MKKQLLNLLCCLLAVASLYANEDNKGNISGKVTTSNGQPAISVTVTLKDTRYSALTNDEGDFIIRNVPVGNYRLEISLIGYETVVKEVKVKNKQTATVLIQLSLSDKELQEVVVNAGKKGYIVNNPSASLRLQTPLLETPQNIQVVTNDMLKDQQVISMSDGLIRNVSGVVRAEHWADLYANLNARGSQIQAFRNGFNVVNSYWGPLTEDMSFVDHIEFIKGPAGFMLSNGDPSGLYNVVTKKPTGQTKGEVSLTLGSFDLYRATLDLDGKLSKDGKWLYRLNLSAQNKKSHRVNEYNNRYVIAPVISCQLDDKTKLTLEYTYQRADMSNIGSFYVFTTDGYGTLPLDFTTLPAAIPGQKINDHSFYANLQHDFNKSWKITGQLSRFIYKQLGASMWPLSIDADGKLIRKVDIWDAYSPMTMGQVFVNGDVTTGIVRHRILAGLDMANKNYYADWGQSHELDALNNPFDPKNPYLGVPVTGYPNFDRSMFIEQRAEAVGGTINQHYASIYLQDELGFFNNKIRLTLAGRYTDLQQAAWGGSPDKAKHFTPRVGVSASVTKTLSVYALYDQAFIPQTGKLVSGSKVQPITGNNMEIGIKKNWFGGTWSTSLALYRILKNNELTPDPNSPPASGLSVELGQKRSQGIEFDLKGTIIKGLDLTANYAYTDSRVVKLADGITEVDGIAIKVGSIVPGYAKNIVNAWLNYEVQNGFIKGTGFSLGASWLSGRATYWEAAPDPSREMKDYFKLDAGLFWENEKIRIAGNIFNVLNEYIYSGSYESWMSTPAYSYQTEPPRNFRLSVNYKF